MLYRIQDGDAILCVKTAESTIREKMAALNFPQ